MNKLLRYFVCFISLVFLFVNFTFSIIQEDSLKIFAVTEDGRGLSADLKLKITEGTGKVWVNITPFVDTSTQNTAIISKKVAKNYFNNVDNYDYFFDISADASVVKGPSAGAAMSLLMIAMLTNRNIPQDRGITGTITEDGYIGEVGGIFEKAKEAAKIGIKVFLIPKGEAKQTIKEGRDVKTINLVEYAPEKWGMKVVEVSNIDEAIKYFFSDLENIPSHTNYSKTPEYIPHSLTIDENIMLMKDIAQKFIYSASVEYEEAKKAVYDSNTNIDNLEYILEGLTDGNIFLTKAKIAYDKNYLYTAANYAFLARVNFLIVKDIFSNPSIINQGSSVFSDKVSLLRTKIDKLEIGLNENLYVDNIDWQIGAMQRLSWAKQNYEKIFSSTKITIINNNNEISIDNSENLKDYAFALVWLEVSEMLHNSVKMTSKNDKVLKNRDFKDLEDKIREYILKVEDFKDKINLSDDILDRLNSAKLALNRGEYLNSLYDAASAYALAKASIESSDSNVYNLESKLNRLISDLEINLSKSNYKNIWPKIYLTHAKYLHGEAIFYKDQNIISSYRSSLESSYSIAVLAQEIYFANKFISDKLELNLPTTKNNSENIVNNNILDGNVVNYGTISNLQFSLVTIFLFVILFILFLSIFYLIFIEIKKSKVSYLTKRLKDLYNYKSKLESLHISGKINKEEYFKEIERVSKEINNLEIISHEKAEHLLLLENLRSIIKSADNEIKELEHLYNQGVLTSEELACRVDKINKNIANAFNSKIKGSLKSLKKVKKYGIKK